MEPKSSMNTNTVIVVITAGVIALLLGASASVNLEEFVVPSLQMDDVTLGLVDDVTSTKATPSCRRYRLKPLNPSRFPRGS